MKKQDEAILKAVNSFRLYFSFKMYCCNIFLQVQTSEQTSLFWANLHILQKSYITSTTGNDSLKCFFAATDGTVNYAYVSTRDVACRTY